MVGEGGKYYTVFCDDEKRKQRTFLYSLETMGIVKFESIKEKNNYIPYWKLTKKGEELINSSLKLKRLWEEKRIQDLYNELAP